MKTNIVREFNKKISDETIVNISKKKTYNEIIEELYEENENLASNMLWNTTEQATEILVTDAAKYSKNRLELFGNTEQNDITIIEKQETIDGVITGDGTLSYGTTGGKIMILPCKPNNTYTIKKDKANKRFKICDYPTIVTSRKTLNNLKEHSGAMTEVDYTTSSNANYIYVWCWYAIGGDTDDNIPTITAEIGINPDYPQYIHVVTGNNTININGTNYSLDLTDIELCKIDNFQDVIFKNTKDSSLYNVELEDNGWYVLKKIKKYTIKPDTNMYIENVKTNGVFEFNFSNHSSLNYNNALIYCNFYKNKVSFTTSCCYNVYNKETRIVNQYDDNFTSEMSTQEAKNKFLEMYADKLFFYTVKEQEHTQITDETLISQLDEIYEHFKLVKGSNHITVTAEDLAPKMKLTYMQDLPSKLDKIKELESRLSLLE